MSDETLIDKFDREHPGELRRARFECHHGYEGPCRAYREDPATGIAPCNCEDDELRLDAMRKSRPRRRRLTDAAVDALVAGLSQPSHRGITI